ncbi:MAG: hypothetical protein IJJ25_13270 [Lachnospiraceae bacterium]|nr:hypothetical protein [Lachnospiraceae bacterium]
MKSIAITFPNGCRVVADFAGKETELEENLWNFLKDGRKDFVCHHTGSTGGLINSYPFPDKKFMMVAPKEPLLLCGDLAGMIGWNGFDLLLMHEELTEPLISGAGEIAHVREEQLAEYMEACKDVWYHCYLYHKLAVISAERFEEA